MTDSNANGAPALDARVQGRRPLAAHTAVRPTDGRTLSPVPGGDIPDEVRAGFAAGARPAPVPGCVHTEVLFASLGGAATGGAATAIGTPNVAGTVDIDGGRAWWFFTVTGAAGIEPAALTTHPMLRCVNDGPRRA